VLEIAKSRCRDVTRVWTRFARNTCGNVAVTFALSILPVVGTVGFAVDYSHANAVKVAMQTALDSTALMLAKDAASLSSSELQTKATNYFKALFTKPEATNVTVAATYSTSGGSAIVVNGSAQVPTAFLGIIGYNSLTVNGSSTSKWGTNLMQVALALDTTGSMASDGKLTALISATKSLLSQLKAAATNNGDIYVSIVPFSRNVNLDSSNYNANWIDWTDWEAEPPYMATWLANSSNLDTWEQTGPGDSCPFSSSKTGFGCTKTPANNSQSTSTVPSSGTYSGYICPDVDTGGKISTQNGIYYNGCYNSVSAKRTISSGWGASCNGASNCSCSGSGSSKKCTQDYYAHNWVKNARSTWNGCITDRGSATAPGTNAGNDQTAVAPTTGDATTLLPARQDSYCPVTGMGLNYNWSAMTSLVNGLEANGSTNQPIGLVTAWHTLAGVGPFTVPAAPTGLTYAKVIILLSDGLNTQDRWYGNGSSTSTSVDNRMYNSSGAGTCANIKAAGITIYTIQVNTGGDPTSTLLRNCASSSDKFFLVTSASQILDVFTQIGTNLSQLRVAK
jgi:Flp pilus assembly protein TadG